MTSGPQVASMFASTRSLEVYAGFEKYKAMAVTCTACWPPLEQRKYIVLDIWADYELESIESIRNGTDHEEYHGDLVCELCLGNAEELSEQYVPEIRIDSLPWLPHRLLWSETLEEFTIASRNEVELNICMSCYQYVRIAGM